MRALALAGLLVSCASNRSLTLPAAHDAAGPLSGVAFIAGAWRADTGEEELWSAPSGGVMLGSGRVVRDDKLVFFEFMRIEARGDAVVYVAQPRGGPATEFTLTNSTGSAATFDNPAHDFPRRIVYALDGSALSVHVEGVENGKPLSENVTLRRAQ